MVAGVTCYDQFLGSGGSVKELDPLLMVRISEHKIAVGSVQEDVFNHTSVENKQEVQCDWEPTFCRWQRVFVGSYYGCLWCGDQSSPLVWPLMEVGQWVVESWSQMSKISSFTLKTLRRRWLYVSQWVRWATGCWWVVTESVGASMALSTEYLI